MVIFLLYQQFDFDSFVYPFHLDSIREVLQEILTRYRGAEEGLSRLDWELYVGGQRRRPRFPVPLIEISMLIGLHNNKERHKLFLEPKNVCLKSMYFRFLSWTCSRRESILVHRCLSHSFSCGI